MTTVLPPNRFPLSPFPLNKRKRGQNEPVRFQEGQIEYSNNRLYIAKTLKELIERKGVESNNVLKGKISLFNDLIIFGDSSSHIVRNILQTDPKIFDIPTEPFETLSAYSDLLIRRGEDNSREIIISSGTAIVLFVLENDGRIASYYHDLRFRRRGEIVTALSYTADRVLLSTSYDEIYVIRVYGRSLEARRLEKNQNIILGLVQVGAELLGISSTQKARDHNTQSYLIAFKRSLFGHVVSTDYLLHISGSSISLWVNWSSGNAAEEFLWEYNLNDSLGAEVISFNGYGGVSVLDVLLMPGTIHSDDVDIVTLSSRQTPHASELWLHSMKISLDPRTAGKDSSRGPDRVQRVVGVRGVLLSKTAVNHPINSPLLHGVVSPSTSPSDLHYHHTSSWLVFTSWIDSSDAAAADSSALLTLQKTLHLGHYDTRTLPLVQTGLLSDVDVASSPMNTTIAADDVMSVSSVEGLDGLVIARTDGSLMVARPPLCRMTRADRTVTIQSSKGGAVTDAERALKEDIDAVIHLAAKEGSDEVVSRLRAQLSSVPSLVVATELRRVATSIASLEAAKESSDDLSVFRLAHSSLQNRSASLERLQTALEKADMWEEQVVIQALGAVRQSLLGCLSLNAHLQEYEQRLSRLKPGQPFDGPGTDGAAGTTSAFQSLSTVVEVVLEGMKSAIHARSTADAVEIQGMAVQDKFFCEPTSLAEGLYHVSQSFEKKIESMQNNTNVQLIRDITALMASMTLAVLKASAESNTSTNDCLITQNKTRYAVLSILNTLSRFKEESQGAPTQTSEKDASIVLRNRTKIGLRRWSVDGVSSSLRSDSHSIVVLELSELVLEGFLSEVAEHSRGQDLFGEHQNQTWKDLFNSAKNCYLPLLMSFELYHQVFEISSRTLHPATLLQAADKDPILISQLASVLAEKGSSKGSLDNSLAYQIFLLLEAAGRTTDLFNLGKANIPVFEEFLQTRPSLSWIYYLKTSNYEGAAEQALSATSEQKSAAVAKALLSIASLSAYVAGSASDIDDGPAVEGENVDGASRPLTSLSRYIDSGMAVLRAQEILASFRSEAAAPDTRLRVTDLIPLLLNTAEDKVLNRSEGLEPFDDSAARLLSCALALISDLCDMLQDFYLSDPSSSSPDKHDYEIHKERYQQYFITVGLQLDNMDATRNWVNSQITRVWSVAVFADREKWLNIAKDTVASPESAYLETTFYSLLSMNRNEAAHGRIRKDILPDVVSLKEQSEMRTCCSLLLDVIGFIFPADDDRLKARLMLILGSCVDELSGSIPY